MFEAIVLLTIWSGITLLVDDQFDTLEGVAKTGETVCVVKHKEENKIMTLKMVECTK
jgi:uncharacterized protein YkuJ